MKLWFMQHLQDFNQCALQGSLVFACIFLHPPGSYFHHTCAICRPVENRVHIEVMVLSPDGRVDGVIILLQ